MNTLRIFQFVSKSASKEPKSNMFQVISKFHIKLKLTTFLSCVCDIMDNVIKVIGSKEWNDLPSDILEFTTVESFKSALNTHLFKISYK